MFSRGIILLACVTWLGYAYPVESEGYPQWLVREKRAPLAARTMIFIRGQPSNNGYHYERPDRAFNPRAAMEAYATGGTVAAGSFYGAPSRKQTCGDCNQLVDEQPDLSPPEETAAPVPEEEPKPVPEEIPAEEEGSKESPPATERQPKAEKAPKTPKRRPPVQEEDDDDDEDDDDNVPRKGTRSRGGSVYRNFFPMMFGGGGSGARDAEGDRGRGTATAIANSFSKGRGAIASSSATAYGSPDGNQYRQNQPSRYRA